jgi:hypothetical protein
MIFTIVAILGWVVVLFLACVCFVLLFAIGAQQAQISEKLEEIDYLKNRLNLKNLQSRAKVQKSNFPKDYISNFEKWDIKKFRD